MKQIEKTNYPYNLYSDVLDIEYTENISTDEINKFIDIYDRMKCGEQQLPGGLNDRTVKILNLRYKDRLGFDPIASRMGLSKWRINDIIARAKRMLRFNINHPENIPDFQSDIPTPENMEEFLDMDIYAFKLPTLIHNSLKRGKINTVRDFVNQFTKMTSGKFLFPCPDTREAKDIITKIFTLRNFGINSYKYVYDAFHLDMVNDYISKQEEQHETHSEEINSKWLCDFEKYVFGDDKYERVSKAESIRFKRLLYSMLDELPEYSLELITLKFRDNLRYKEIGELYYDKIGYEEPVSGNTVSKLLETSIAEKLYLARSIDDYGVTEIGDSELEMWRYMSSSITNFNLNDGLKYTLMDKALTIGDFISWCMDTHFPALFNELFPNPDDKTLVKKWLSKVSCGLSPLRYRKLYETFQLDKLNNIIDNKGSHWSINVNMFPLNLASEIYGEHVTAEKLSSIENAIVNLKMEFPTEMRMIKLRYQAYISREYIRTHYFTENGIHLGCVEKIEEIDFHIQLGKLLIESYIENDGTISLEGFPYIHDT